MFSFVHFFEPRLMRKSAAAAIALSMTLSIPAQAKEFEVFDRLTVDGDSTTAGNAGVTGKASVGSLRIGTATTAGNVLTADSGGNASWTSISALGSGNVSGSGTVKKIAMFSGVNAVGDSVVTQDDNGNIGVGLTNPSYRFGVIGTFGVSSDFSGWGNLSVAGKGAFFGLVSAPGVDIVGTAGAHFGYGTYSDPAPGILRSIKVGNVGIGVNGDSNFNGNVGIGSMTPTAKLDVVGEGNISGKVSAGALRVGTSSIVNQVLSATDATGNVGWMTIATGSGNANATGTINKISKFTAAGNLGNSLITDTGTNVGIGSATPTAALDVSGASKFSSSVTAAGAISGASVASTGATTVGGTLGVTGATTLDGTLDVTDAVTLSSTVSVSGQASVGALRVGTSTTAGNVLTADSGGNASWTSIAALGAGNVNGPVSSTANTVAVFADTTGKKLGNSGVSISSSNVTGVAALTASGTITGGNVYSTSGVTTGTLKVTGGSPQYGQILSAVDGTGLTQWKTLDAGGNVSGPGTVTVSVIPVYADTTGQNLAARGVMINSSNDIVGARRIALSDYLSAASLSTSGTTTTGALKITGGSPTEGKVFMASDNTGAGVWMNPSMLVSGNVDGTGIPQYAALWADGGNSVKTSEIYQTPLGNVSLGATSAPKKLTVTNRTSPSSGGMTGQGILVDFGSGGGVYVSDSANGAYARNEITGWPNQEFRSGTSSAHPDTFYTSNAERMRIDSSGRIGIGIAAPTYAVDIKTNTASAGDPMRIADAENAQIKMTSDNGDFNVGVAGTTSTMADPGQFFIYDSLAYAQRFMINGDGNVGIGSTHPTQKLEVGGTAKATAVTTGSLTVSGGSPVADQVLSAVNGTGLTQWKTLAAGGGGNVSGTGGSGYLSKFTGATMIGNSGMYQEASGNIGIGTTQPIGNLDIWLNQANNNYFWQMRAKNANANGVAQFAVENNSGIWGALIAYGSTNAESWGLNDSVSLNSNGALSFGTNQDLDSGGTSGIRFFTGGYNLNNERLTIAADGKIGIGTIQPSVPLQVNVNTAGSYDDAIRAKNTDATGIASVGVVNNAGVWGSLAVYGGSAGSTLGLQNKVSLDASGSMTIGSDRAVASGGSGTIMFLTGGNALGNERMTISGDGNVGIGTTIPTALFQVAGMMQTKATSSEIQAFKSPGAIIDVDPSAGDIMTITPKTNTTLNIATVIPGQRLTLIVTSPGLTSYQITFGTNFRTTGPLTMGVPIRVYVVSFVSDETTYYEVSRTTAM